MMSISKDKTRTPLTISKYLKKQLEEIARQNKISFNKLVISILKSYVDNLK